LPIPALAEWGEDVCKGEGCVGDEVRADRLGCGESKVVMVTVGVGGWVLL